MRNGKKLDGRDHLAGASLIACKQCTTLALLTLDGIPLCKRCMIKETTNRDTTWIQKHSRPLNIRGAVRKVESTVQSHAKKKDKSKRQLA
ncbi:MAG: hypothetical protein GY847_08505 [Proteobacteria bacterium]|nr:hypothetical protein [Pseudomonadota bacterium]